MRDDAWVTIGVVALLLGIAILMAAQTSAIRVYVVSSRRHARRRARIKAGASGVQFVNAVDGGARRLSRFRSHVRAWRLVAASAADQEFALVFEDSADVRLPSAWSKIRTVIASCPGDWDVVFLGTKRPLRDSECVAQGGRCSVKRVDGDASGLHAIALRGAGARKLLAAWESQGARDPAGGSCPVDVWVSRLPDVTAYWVDPSLVKLAGVTRSS